MNNAFRGGCGIFRMYEVIILPSTEWNKCVHTDLWYLYCDGVCAGTKGCIRRHNVFENIYTPSLSQEFELLMH